MAQTEISAAAWALLSSRLRCEDSETLLVMGYESAVNLESQKDKIHSVVPQTQHDQLYRRGGLSCSIQCWCGLVWITVGSSGLCNLRRVWRSLNVSGGEQQSRGWNVLWGAAEGFWFVLFREKEAEGWAHCSPQLPEKGKWRVRYWALLSDPVTVGMVENCTGGG